MQKAKNIPFHSRPLSGSLLVRYSWLMYVMLLLCKLLGLNFTDGSEHVLYRRLHVVRKARRIGQMADMRSIFCIFALHCDNVGCLCHAVLNIGTVPPWDCRYQDTAAGRSADRGQQCRKLPFFTGQDHNFRAEHGCRDIRNAVYAQADEIIAAALIPFCNLNTAAVYDMIP